VGGWVDPPTELALVVGEDDGALGVEELGPYDVVDREVELDDHLQQIALLGVERPLEHILFEHRTEVGRDRLAGEASGLVLNVAVEEIRGDAGDPDGGDEQNGAQRDREPADRSQG
jgi:hypothetical protein